MLAVVSIQALKDLLTSLDGASYGAYKRIKGRWHADGVTLCIDHVQGDPFATASSVRICIDVDTHAIPTQMRTAGARTLGLCHVLIRAFAAEVALKCRASGGAPCGQVSIDVGGAQVLARSCCAFVGDSLELRFRVGLPARGRRILGRVAAVLLGQELIAAAAAVNWSQIDRRAARKQADLCEEHTAIAQQLVGRGLIAFVANGSMLPRSSGVCERPLPGAVPFTAPPKLEVEFQTLHHGRLKGMGVPHGITLITGGGFHGKTTLLKALANGVYPHTEGDGREFVVTRADALKLRSEDGRSVVGVDVSAFISDLPGHLPGDAATKSFTTEDASGSTSLAAGMLEGIEAGAGVVMLDEDTSATNLLIRDARMQRLVSRETICPLVDRVRELFAEHAISTVLVVGGCGDYLSVADTVLLMEDFLPKEVSAEAKMVVQEFPTRRVPARGAPFVWSQRRVQLASLEPRSQRGRAKLRVRVVGELAYGDATLDLGGVEQLVDPSQTRAIGALLRWLSQQPATQVTAGTVSGTVAELANRAIDAAHCQGLFALGGQPELAAVRPLELASALNRLRTLQLCSQLPTTVVTIG